VNSRPENWVFLGDSLTEGVGSSRVSYVTELANYLRETSRRNGHKDLSVHEFRLRKVDPKTFNPFLHVNVAGNLRTDQNHSGSSVWLWNLACEGKTIESDSEWLPFLNNLRPELVVLFRGSLESIIRPSMLKDKSWPCWVPATWRGYAAMDPRCYFSTTLWRRLKQMALDALKQKLRLRFLRKLPGVPLLEPGILIGHYRTLLACLRELDTRVVVLGLLPVSGDHFPGSPEHFRSITGLLEEVAVEEGAEFINWGAYFESRLNLENLLYRDGFHPNLAGARALAQILIEPLARIPAK
jgi:hypothetical protein